MKTAWAGTLAASVMLFSVPFAGAETEKVTLKNGITYTVETENGMPVAFRSENLEITSLGFIMNDKTKEFEWVLQGKLKADGEFDVLVKTAMNSRLSTKFHCTGPGDIFQRFFDSRMYPVAWNWIEEPGVTWVPMRFTFKSVPAGKRFEALQWTKFNPGAKATLQRIWKRVESPRKGTKLP